MTMPDSLREIVGEGDAEVAVATIDENGVDVDGDEVLLKVTCHPSQAPRTVRLGFDYVGPGFGIYSLPKDGDEFLCLFPRDAGIGVAVKRLNNSIDKIPQDLRDLKDKNPLLIVHASGWKLKASDDKISLTAGSVPIEVFGNDVKLGNSSALRLANENLKQALADLVLSLNIDMTAIKAHTNIVGAPDPTLAAIGNYSSPGSSTLTTKVKAT